MPSESISSRAMFESASYDAGYKEGFAEGIKHAQDFIEKSATPHYTIAAPSPIAAEDVDGAQMIVRERERQKSQERWTPEHDDEHDRGQMAVAGAWYAIHHTDATMEYPDNDPEESGWPWGAQWCKPKDDIRNLARAGALIAAEIDRIKRRDATK